MATTINVNVNHVTNVVKARINALGAICDERNYQDKKWGTVQECPHEVGAWLTIIRHCLNRAEAAYVTGEGDVGALDELRKVASVSLACMEQHGAVYREAGHVPSV